MDLEQSLQVSQRLGGPFWPSMKSLKGYFIKGTNEQSSYEGVVGQQMSSLYNEAADVLVGGLGSVKDLEGLWLELW